LSEIVAEGDLVAWRWVGAGTHEHSYMGVPATHKRVGAEGLTISRFRDGLIAEEWASWNKVTVLHRLGIFPIDQT
jgi:predicted ester cyclase